MNSEREPKSSPPASPAPRLGLQLMGLILVAMALLSIYSNIQKTHLGQIEKVTIIDQPAPPSSPAISPSPAAR